MSITQLSRLLEQRTEQLAFVDQLMTAAADQQRDLVPAEVANLNGARQRITELDDQIGPIQEYEQLRESAATVTANAMVARRQTGQTAAIGGARTEPRVGLGQPAALAGTNYATAGSYLADLCRAKGYFGMQADTAAAARIEQAAAGPGQQTTGDTPGVLPTPIVGPVQSNLDPSRPLITSLGAKALPSEGRTFERPKITQHVQVGVQTEELGKLPTRKMKIDPLTFTKTTHGGTVEISRQDIDFTSPAAWDALITDLSDVYAIDTETACATGFAAGVTQGVPVADNSLQAWVDAYFQAAVLAYKGGGRLPDEVWMSLDMWATVGALTDAARLTGAGREYAGTANLRDFGGYLLDLPRVVVPTFPANTLIIGNSAKFEYYEQMIGLLSQIMPSVLGVEVAFGGYAAFGFIEALGFAKVNGTIPPATGATAGTPGQFTPAGAELPANLAAMSSVLATPQEAWTTGQYVSPADASKAHWNGTAWVNGPATTK